MCFSGKLRIVYIQYTLKGYLILALPVVFELFAPLCLQVKLRDMPSWSCLVEVQLPSLLLCAKISLTPFTYLFRYS